MISKFHVSADGKTSYERAKEKPYRNELVEFGEKVFYRRGKLDKKLNLEGRWEKGIILGMCWRTDIPHMLAHPVMCIVLMAFVVVPKNFVGALNL